MGLFGKKVKLTQLMGGFRDIHCHFLPGVDDGARDVRYARQMLQAIEDMGVIGLYTTPHIINGMYDSHDEEWLRKAFAEFDHESNLDIRLAAEYFIDDKFLEHLRGKPLTFADNHVLAEFSMSAYAINSFDILFEASLEGFNIILAHPERYTFVQQDRKESYIAKFIDRGYRLQLNLLSLTGYHGPAARKTAEKLLDEGAYTFVGTDIHSGVYIDAIKGASVSEKVFEKLIALKENNNSLF